MKKNIKIYLMVGALVTGLTACQKRDFLAPPPITAALDLQKTFSDEINTSKFLANCYAPLTGGLDDFSNGQNFAQLSDEAEAGPAYLATNGANFGAVDATNNLDNVYAAMYTNIRRTNVLIANANLMTFTPASKAKFVAEARFLRAFYYFELVKRIGGVPLITSAVTFEELKDAAAQQAYKDALKRASFADCVDFIVKELTAAETDLPWAPANDNDRGRATAAACVALKAKTLLYAASKLFNNETPAPAGQPGSMSRPDIGYTSYDKNRWKLAADACRDFLAKNLANGNWYTLYAGGYDKLFTESRDAANHELIWYRQSMDNGAIYSNPAGRLAGYAHNQLLVNLVDKYEMLNGKTKDEAGSGYDEQQWWVNRDPRLAFTVLKNDDTFKGYKMEFWSNQGGVAQGQDYQDTYKTSLFFKKFQRQDANTGVQKWHYLRLADIYLMLAEAENEFNGPGDAYQYVNIVRKRASVNMPDLATGLTQVQMREKIRNERAVEFALEAQRYYDVRRWMIAENIDNGPVYGFKVTKIGGVIKHERYVIENRIFQKRMYLAAIPIAEVYKGTAVEQNPGY